MAYCTNCGQKLPEGAKFCTNCGQRVLPHKKPTSQRETVYEGKLYKCPNCGELISSFVGSCPACGYELRGAEATFSAQEFYRELNRRTTVEEKDEMIRSFPIPNAKEDILEFMILASSNILGEDERDIYEAWLAKFEQAYQKARLLFQSDEDFVKIQSIYENCQNNIASEKQRQRHKFTLETVLRNIVFCAGILLLVSAAFVDRSGGNSSLMEPAACIVLIASAASLGRRGASLIDYAVCIGSGLFTVLLSFAFENGSVVQLCGVIVLIVGAVNSYKGVKNSHHSNR